MGNQLQETTLSAPLLPIRLLPLFSLPIFALLVSLVCVGISLPVFLFSFVLGPWEGRRDGGREEEGISSGLSMLLAPFPPPVLSWIIAFFFPFVRMLLKKTRENKTGRIALSLSLSFSSLSTPRESEKKKKKVGQTNGSLSHTPFIVA
ncbi:hypothetical protein F5H01DRAFT_93236 [Linnemannia elongata]|nr:hypothetical protein F5H01DRAFT_93236 [Linnemannia elongata]